MSRAVDNSWRLELRLFENGDPDLSLVASLPALAATRDSVIESHVSVASAFLPRARSAVARAGESFPSKFEQAAWPSSSEN